MVQYPGVESMGALASVTINIATERRSYFNSLADRMPEFFMHSPMWQALPPEAAHVSVIVSPGYGPEQGGKRQWGLHERGNLGVSHGASSKPWSLKVFRQF